MLQNHVTSLELSKKLKELGVRKPSIHQWVDGEIWDLTMQSDYQTPNTVSQTEWLPAYLVSELGMMIPDGLVIGTVPNLSEDNKITQWVCQSYANLYCDKIPHQVASTEADARAEMLIYLLENGLITINDVNK